jgi:hypothetical protein
MRCHVLSNTRRIREPCPWPLLKPRLSRWKLIDFLDYIPPVAGTARLGSVTLLSYGKPRSNKQRREECSTVVS